MVRDIHEETGDLPWLRGALRTLIDEHDFWMERRSTVTGLNRHYHDDDDDGARRFCAEIYTGRLHLPIPAHPFAQKLAGDHYYAEAETGWDFNPRFDRRCADFLPVDLNSLLYQVERNLAHFHRELDLDEASFFDHAAEARKALVTEYLWDDDEGFFYDYDFTRAERSRVRAGSALHPLYSRAATPEQARRLVANISKIEADHGILTCEKTDSGIVYQWDWPNGWPPVQGYAMMGLLNAGFPEDAERVAQKYIRLCTQNFERTGKLWEKYNVVDGTTRVNDEYPMPPMVGWTAGVFLLACEIAGL
jgi:alpha,alpha-trehalase